MRALLTLDKATQITAKPVAGKKMSVREAGAL
jgi:hypothetical protein